ncbi:PstS family phosphate ABC transporter substrate-binding protein [Roseimarinus sediminis]|uniref:PstS family phosphate ABC transporter substrate-binding protein n=1 Tax=Roseimarinus sediminis TaxID=1610899 RepID=UPI003D238F59
MKTSKTIIFILIMALFNSCASKKQKEQTISISGAFALYPLVVMWAEEYKKENPDVRFNISGGGAGKGMADALSGTVDLGMFSREIAPAEINKGVWWAGLTIDAVLPTISAKNPYLNALKTRGLTRDELKAVYIDGDITNWNRFFANEEANEIVVYTRSDACGAAGTWAKYLGGTQEDLQGIGIYGDPGLAEAVGKDPLGVAFNNTIFIYDIESSKKRPGIEVIPIDLNENGHIDADEDFYNTFDEILAAIASGNYPSPPARELYFVSDGKPEKQAALDFIKWCLTSGQQYIKEAGYVPISKAKIDGYLEKL